MKSSGILLLAATAFAQGRFQPGVKPFLASEAPVIALAHVRVIDGTGAAAREDQTVIVDHGKIAAIGPASSTPAPTGAQVMELSGHTVIPGLVGMHEHLVYPGGGGVPLYPEMGYSFPRLYLATGVTAARTAGSVDPFTDLEIKKLIAAGRMPGPNLYITGPTWKARLLHAANARLTGPGTRHGEFWARPGATSFKACMNITRSGWRRQWTLRISAGSGDEPPLLGRFPGGGGDRDRQPGAWAGGGHGVSSRQKPDVCPPNTRNEVARMDLNTAPVREMIADLVKHTMSRSRRRWPSSGRSMATARRWSSGFWMRYRRRRGQLFGARARAREAADSPPSRR